MTAANTNEESGQNINCVLITYLSHNEDKSLGS